MIKEGAFIASVGDAFGILRLGSGICPSLWSLSSPQAFLLKTALLISALRRNLAFVSNNLRSSGRWNDSCFALFARWHAMLSAQSSYDTLWPCRFSSGGSSPFLETPFPGGYVSVLQYLTGWVKLMRSPWSMHRLLQRPQRFGVAKCFVQVQGYIPGRFRGRYLLRQMFSVLAEFQQPVIFTSGPWGILVAYWSSCLLPMLISFCELSSVQFRFIYTASITIKIVSQWFADLHNPT